ncbi:hypothetical protein GCM10020219_041250 [Nonomuraea dietziae]
MLEQVVEDDQSFQEVAAEPSTSWTVSRSPSRDVGQRGEQVGPVTGGELAACLLLDDLQADRIEGVMLPLGVLLVGADPDKSDERHGEAPPFIKRHARGI